MEPELHISPVDFSADDANIQSGSMLAARARLHGRKMENPGITVGVAVYNGQDFLRETLDSLLAQTYKDFTLLISDNCSTDRTQEICEEFLKKDSRVRYNRNPRNIGLAGNYNFLLNAADRKYFKWATADDVCKPTYLEKCIKVLEENETVVLVYPQTEFIGSKSEHISESDPGWHLMQDNVAERLAYVIDSGHWVNAIVGVIRTSALKKTAGLPIYPGGDFGLLGELSVLGKFCELPEQLYLRRLHKGASSQHTADPGWLVELYRGKRAPCMPYWSLIWHHYKTIRGARLGGSEKGQLYRQLLRNCRWQRKRLFEDLRYACMAYLTQSKHTEEQCSR